MTNCAPAGWADIPIPSITVGPLVEDEDGVLLWVHTGAAVIEAAGTRHRLEAGAAIWMPVGVAHTTRTEPGAVVFPLRLPHAGRPLDIPEPRAVTIPPGWSDWLIHQWDDNSATRDAIPGAEALVDLLAGAAVAPDGSPPGRPAPLRLPRSPEAIGVARTLLRTPGTPRGIETFAARERISVKTLQRQFLQETGLSFSTWRTRARIAAAARRLDDGAGVGATGRAVGYVTAAGFTKAFRLHTGLTPREYAARDVPERVGRRTSPTPAVPAVPTDRPGSRTRAAPAASAPSGAHLPTAPDALIAGGIGDAPLPMSSTGARHAPPPIPARTFWEKVNDHHELMWVHRGSATLTIGSRSWALTTGEALWVPAGLTHTVRMDAASLLLTAGAAHGRFPIGVDDLLVFHFPDEAEALLLHTMVSAFSLFRPERDPGALVRMLFHEQFLVAGPLAGRPTGALGELALALRRDPADSRSLAGWAAQLRVAPEHLAREIASQTGSTFPRWRARIRMDIARDLLRSGEPAGLVSRRLGYATPAAFARAFTTAHGLPPSDYRRREQL